MLLIERTQADIEYFTRNVFKKFTEEGLTHIVGLARGGLIPATMVAYYFDLPIVVANYSSVNSPNAWNSKEKLDFLPDSNFPLTSESRILLVDDISDTGHTMKEAKAEFERISSVCFTATIDVREDTIFVPDYTSFGVPKNSVILYPWNLDA